MFKPFFNITKAVKNSGVYKLDNQLIHMYKSKENYMKIEPGEDSEHNIICICPISVFDRWANSRHMRISVYEKWSAEIIMIKISESDKILRRIPQKYFNGFLKMEY